MKFNGVINNLITNINKPICSFYNNLVMIMIIAYTKESKCPAVGLCNYPTHP